MAARPRPRRSSKSPADAIEALSEAVFRLDTKRVTKLLGSPPCSELTPRELGRLLFHTDPNATSANQVALFRLLLSRGADPNVRDDEGDPLVADTAYRMSPAALREVLARGADPDAEGGRALGLVSSAPAKDTAKKLAILVAAGADINARPWTADNENALMFAIATKAIDLATCRALIELGIDVNAKDRHGATALDKADTAGVTEIAALIRSKGGRHGRAKADRDRPTHIEQVLYAQQVARSKSRHACGLPIESLYRTSKALGGRFPGCAFPPKHLVSLQLGELPFPPAVQRVGMLHVVHAGCQDCEPEYVDYEIDKSGKLSPLGADDRKGRCTSPQDPDYERPVGVRLSSEIRGSQRLALEVGGTPHWHQQAVWPSCETCGLRMFFIVQIGGGDRLYVFLCEKCRVTSTVRQIN